MLYGTIIGDMAGSNFEYLYHKFPIENWTSEELVMMRGSRFTDDTVMTIAVANTLLEVGENPTKETIQAEAVKQMRNFGFCHRECGFGSMFSRWLRMDNPQPYDSFGNGAAMRIAPVAWYYQDDLDTALQVAEWITRVSHNNDIAVKGAQATVLSIICMIRGGTLNQLIYHIKTKFGYENLSRELRYEDEYDDIRCDIAVIKAIRSLFHSNSFDDCIRKSIMYSNDTDTIAAIAGSIAEPYYMLNHMHNKDYWRAREMTINKLPADFRTILNKFEIVIKTKFPREDYI